MSRSAFALPRLAPDSPASREMFSFDRAALVTLGSYRPGKEATVYDPIWTGARFPSAVVEHEMVHQTLTINTTFGFLTQVLIGLARRGLVGNALVACHHVQWPVQEAAATYCELAVVARNGVGQLQSEILRLPSDRLGQPPYRELFDAMNSALPLEAASDHEAVRAMAILVKMLAFAAMNTECLRRASRESKPSEKAVLEAISDEPQDRLERLVWSLEESKVFPALIDETRAFLAKAGEGTSLVGPWLYERLHALAPRAIAWEKDDVRSAARHLAHVWRDWIDGKSELCTFDEDPLPKFGYGSERAREEMRTYKPKLFPNGAIRARAAAAARLGQAIMIELALRDPSLAHVKLGAYLPARPGEPWPASDFTDEAAASLPSDITGLATPESIIHELEGFSALPRVVSFLDPGFEHFFKAQNAHDIFRTAIRVCRLTELSLEQLCNAHLHFEGIGEAFLRLRFSASFVLGCLLQAKGAEAFIIVRLTSEPAENLFVGICENLGFHEVTGSAGLEREIGLLSMMGRW